VTTEEKKQLLRRGGKGSNTPRKYSVLETVRGPVQLIEGVRRLRETVHFATLRKKGPENEQLLLSNASELRAASFHGGGQTFEEQKMRRGKSKGSHEELQKIQGPDGFIKGKSQQK